MLNKCGGDVLQNVYRPYYKKMNNLNKTVSIVPEIIIDDEGIREVQGMTTQPSR